jgi:hypothetical protein
MVCLREFPLQPDKPKLTEPLGTLRENREVRYANMFTRTCLRQHGCLCISFAN